MTDFPGVYRETIVRLSPRARTSGTVDTDQRSEREYDAFVYAEAPFEGLNAPDLFSTRTAPTLASLPLVAAELVTMKWRRYQEYLNWFVEGEKGRYEMRSCLMGALSEGLQSLLMSPRSRWGDRPLRIWWSSQTPELEDMPWELVAQTSPASDNPNFIFVRGVPGERAMPPVRASAPLRLALIGANDPATEELAGHLAALHPGVQAMVLPGSPREAFWYACREGMELVHFVAHGMVSLAYEGILSFTGKDRVQLTTGELSDACHGTRIAVIGLSPATTNGTPSATPTVYRAFAMLASAGLRLPPTLAPLGPMEPPDAVTFWNTFYGALGETLDFGAALARARQSTPALPIAAYPRNVASRLFRKAEARRGGLESFAPQPEARSIAAELDISDELLTRLKAIERTSGKLPDGVEAFVEREGKRGMRLRGELTRLSGWPEDPQ
jgi:hypothetical protein